MLVWKCDCASLDVKSKVGGGKWVHFDQIFIKLCYSWLHFISPPSQNKVLKLSHENKLTCLRLKNPFRSQLGRYKERAIIREVSFIPWMIPSNFLRHGPFKKRQILWAPSYLMSLSELALNTYELRLMFVDGQWWVVHGGSHWALLAKFPLLLFAQGMDFFTAHNVFGMDWHFSWQQFLCNLCGYWVLVRLVICVNTDKPDVTWHCFSEFHFTVE